MPPDFQREDPAAYAAIETQKQRKNKIKQLEKEVEELLAQRKAAQSSPFLEFGKRYFHDPVGFVNECIQWPKDESITPYQAEILAAIPEKKRVAVVACHGAGKSATCALAILWFGLTREACRVPFKAVITASVSTQLLRFLWPEVKEWSRFLNWAKIGRTPFSQRTELLSSALQLQYGQLFCVSPEEPAKLEGAHSPNLLYAIDESRAVPDPIWSSISGAFSGAGEGTGNLAYCLAISTPGPPIGEFYNIHARKKGYENWWCRHIKIEEAIAAKRVSPEWVEEKRRQWGETSSLFKQKVEGTFCSDDELSLIPYDWIQKAIDRSDERFIKGLLIP